MPTTDPRIDAYIANAAPFARPILERLRAIVHAACPRVEETIKWGFPHFLHHGILCSMAAFKQHAVFGFWKGELIDGIGATPAAGGAMGHLGRLTGLGDLPARRDLIAQIHQAMRLNEAGTVVPSRARKPARPVAPVPPELADALRRDAVARATFDAFSPSQRRDYCEWIDEAKRAETRARRVSEALGWLREGKPRNWKYLRPRS